MQAIVLGAMKKSSDKACLHDDVDVMHVQAEALITQCLEEQRKAIRDLAKILMRQVIGCSAGGHAWPVNVLPAATQSPAFCPRLQVASKSAIGFWSHIFASACRMAMEFLI